MGFWLKAIIGALEEKNEQDIDRAWSKALGLKGEAEKDFLRQQRLFRWMKKTDPNKKKK